MLQSIEQDYAGSASTSCSKVLTMTHSEAQAIAHMFNDEPTKVILPEDISNYVESLGRPPAATKEVVSLLSSMQEYDDCSVDAMLRTELFTKEILLFQKKNNALKDFR
jgi:hypothetical protein